MYTSEILDVQGNRMNTLVFEPEGAGHGFQDVQNVVRYRPEQSEDAWQKAIDFLDKHLKNRP